jgi:hypothetical protein
MDKKQKPTIEELKEWKNNPLINPKTKHKIKLNGPIYKFYETHYNTANIVNNIIDLDNNNDNEQCSESDDNEYTTDNNYKDFRINEIDPIMHNRVKSKNAFVFPFKWNPYTGERTDEIDENGPLYFNPDNLIHYFYTNRLNNIWLSSNESNTEYYYGDAIGKGPDFEIKGRGKHYEWYLFRLPIIDCYLNESHNDQYITMGPILTNDEIKTIAKLAHLQGQSYYNEHNKKRPNILEFKKLYDIIVDKEPYLGFEKSLEQYLDLDDLQLRRYEQNISAVKKLIYYK